MILLIDGIQVFFDGSIIKHGGNLFSCVMQQQAEWWPQVAS